MSKHTPAPWEPSKCRVPMWMFGAPSGFCGKDAFGEQYPREYLNRVRHTDGSPPYCAGHACPGHGGPDEGEPIIFRDGWTDAGRPMWCAVMPDFINLQESPSGFSGDPVEAARLLRVAVAEARGEA